MTETPRVPEQAARAAPARAPIVVSLRPQDLFRQGLERQQRGEPATAENLYRQVLRFAPAHADAACMLATALLQQQRHAEAIEQFDHALALAPDNAVAHHNQAAALKAAGRLEESLAAYDRALALKPDYAEAHYNRGVLLADLKRYDDAVQAFGRALAFQPGHAGACNGRGSALGRLRRFDEALQDLDRAVALRPDFAEAWYNRGNTLVALMRGRQALADYDRALALRPDYGEGHLNRGSLLHKLGRLDEALQALDRAVALMPARAGTHNNRGNVLFSLQRYGEALAAFEHALALQPEARNFALGMAAHCRSFIARWDELDELIGRLRDGLHAGRMVCEPLVFASLSDSAADQRLCSALSADFLARSRPAGGALPARAPQRHDGRIRIAYVSGDFRAHAVMRVLAEVFELHDRTRFELFAYDYGRSSDALTPRLKAAFEHVVQVAEWTSERIAHHMREQGIAIAVDLMGHTSNTRADILAWRPAPVQVNYIGYPGTMGAPWIDYIVADRVLTPPALAPHYSEQVVRLPGCYLPVDRQRPAMQVPARAGLGLPETGFVFCCFSNTYKITPELFDVWMRLLKALPGSVLWLLRATQEGQDNLLRQAQARGVDASRLVFMGRCTYGQYLANYQAADLFLDTSPYNALATASDALWMGLPVLTCTGQSYVARGATSIVQAAGLPELAAPDLAAYESLALQLAREPGRLRALRERLATRRESNVLFDTPRYVRHLEVAFERMFELARTGQPPQGFDVAELPPEL